MSLFIYLNQKKKGAWVGNPEGKGRFYKVKKKSETVFPLGLTAAALL